MTKRVRPSLPDSLEFLLHEVGDGSDFSLDLSDNHPLRTALASPLLKRAIGVISRPKTERWGHYFNCRVADQFDVLLHFGQTSALQPFERDSGSKEGELLDTLPSGT